MQKLLKLMLPKNIFRKKRIDPFDNNSMHAKENDVSVGISALMLSIPVGSFVLGCWQVQRRQWKLDLIKTVEENIRSEPVNLPDNLTDLEQMEYKPVKVRGHFIHEDEFIIGPRSLLKEGDSISKSSLFSSPKADQGWLVITPLQLHDREERILINRGWVPMRNKNPKTRLQGLVEDEVEFVGVVRGCEKRPQFMPKNIPSQGAWYYRDLDEMAKAKDCSAVWLDAKGIISTFEGSPVPNQTKINFRNEHLSYIVTWFTLSGFTSWMWFRQCVQKLPLL